MGRIELQRRNHPKPGASIKVDPIRDVKAIQQIKRRNADNPRNVCLFTMGINTAYRATELLSLTVGQVQHLKPGQRLDVKQSKNRTYRATTLNQVVIAAIENWLVVHPCPDAEAPLFLSGRGNRALSVSAVNQLVKKWCREVGLDGNYGSHTFRKTWGYQQRIQNNTSMPLLMSAFGHASERQTLAYLCIQSVEIEKLYDMEL